jgi:hypothetical protein
MIRNYFVEKAQFLNSFAKYGYLVFFGLITQIVSILLPPNSSISDAKSAFCNYYITKFEVFNIHIDCDSQYFLLDSQNPSRLINNQTPLQDRPMFTFLVFVMSKLLEIFGVPTGATTYLGEDNIAQTYHILNYGIFVAINAVILILAMAIVASVFYKNHQSQSQILPLSVLMVTILIAQNPISREFFWTPHSQIFNILVPALLFYLTQKDLVLDKKRYSIWFCFISISLLMYPTFTILLPILFLRVFKTLGWNYSFLLFFTLVPKLLWPTVLNFLGGDYIDWPLVYHRRFIWIFDSIKSKTLLSDLSNNVKDFLSSLPMTWGIITILLLLMCVVLGKGLFRAGTPSIHSANFYGALALVTYALAMILNGGYAPRFTTGIVLLLSFQVLYQVSQAKDRIILCRVFLLGLFITNCFYWFSS